MADRTGFRKVFIASLVLWALSVVGIIASESLVDFVWAFIGIGTGMGGFQMAAQNMVLEFRDREDLPMRIAVANSAQEGVGALGPLIGGVIAVMAGLNTLYIVSIGFQVLAILMVLFWVDEPRHRKT